MTVAVPLSDGYHLKADSKFMETTIVSRELSCDIRPCLLPRSFPFQRHAASHVCDNSGNQGEVWGISKREIVLCAPEANHSHPSKRQSKA